MPCFMETEPRAKTKNASSDFAPVSFTSFEEAYKALTEKLQPQVYELEFLKV